MEHSDLFIQGNSVTAEQIEQLDQNLTQMSLCQNLDVKQEGEYMVDDYDSKLVSRNSKYEIDNEINRIDMYSPDL
jgi:CTP:phosphocholine cytidylyltransferase-like protein